MYLDSCQVVKNELRQGSVFLETSIKLNTERLRSLREQRGWSQRELARRCGFGETQIGKYEAGTVDPSATNLGLLAEVFEVSTDYLLGRTDSPHTHIAENELDEDETVMVKLYRREGWPGVLRLGVERISK